MYYCLYIPPGPHGVAARAMSRNEKGMCAEIVGIGRAPPMRTHIKTEKNFMIPDQC